MTQSSHSGEEDYGHRAYRYSEILACHHRNEIAVASLATSMTKWPGKCQIRSIALQRAAFFAMQRSKLTEPILS